MSATLLAPGFADPVHQAQRCFRALLDVLARPGTIHPLPSPQAWPAPLTPAATALCLTLLDLDTPLWLDSAADRPEVRDYLRFHCNCPLAARPDEARFALLAGGASQAAGLERFNPGDSRYPDRSATLIVQVDTLLPGAGPTMRGPGIRDAARLDARGLPQGFWPEFAANCRRFPVGVDVFLVAETEVAGLPRSLRVEV